MPSATKYVTLFNFIQALSDAEKKDRAVQILSEVTKLLEAAIKENDAALNENRRQREYLIGQAVALEGKEDELRRRSGEMFSQGGNDERAKWLRDLASECKQEAAALRGEVIAMIKVVD